MAPKKGKKKKGALSEEEERKRREDLIEQFLQLKASKELNQTHMNKVKLENKWRSIMRDSKSNDLKQEIEILSQTFERVVDRKEHMIKKMTETIVASDEQQRMAIGAHIHNINQLIEIQKERLQLLKRDFDMQQGDVVSDFDGQANQIKKTYRDDMEYMADLIFGLETTYMNAEQEYRSDFQSRMDEIRNKNTEERQHMQELLEHHMEELWHQMQHTLQTYNEHTEDRRKAYDNLREKDERSTQIIDMQMMTIQKINDTIAQLKNRILHTAKEQEERSRSLIEDREEMKKQFMTLKTHLKSVDQRHHDYLIHLTDISNKALGELKQQVYKAEKIIRLGSMCTKYETEEEKILPFYQSSLTEDEKQEIEELNEKNMFQEPLAALLTEYSGLENFWKRFSKVQLDRLALEKEKQVLTAKNERLCLILRQYLENISVPAHAVEQPHSTLLFINRTIEHKMQSIPVGEKRVIRKEQKESKRSIVEPQLAI